jgi:nucleotide-binding universal stress UspA family protein
VSGARRIIIGCSGSPGSLLALRHAAGLAHDHDASLVPVLAWLPPGGELADRRFPSRLLRQVWVDTAWLQMWTTLERAWGGIAPAGRPAEPRAVRGEPGQVLVTAASERGDWLVIGAGHRGLLRPLPGGRVARYCRAHAVSPLIAVPPPGLDQAAGHGLRGWAFRHRALDVDRLAALRHRTA